ncbi:hypothetical protein OKW43_007599 [Paraburkholderia sp. WC7.3g]
MIPGSNVKFPDASAGLPTPTKQLLAEYAREAVLVVIGNAVIAAGLTVVGIGKSLGENISSARRSGYRSCCCSTSAAFVFSGRTRSLRQGWPW